MSTVKKVAEAVKETVAVEKKPAAKAVAKKAPAKKAETKAVVEKTVETVVKEEVKKPVEKKAAVKTTAAKKTTAKATEEKKPVAKKATAAKKPATKKAVKAEVKMAIQFADKNYTAEDLTKIANDVWVYDYGKDASELKDIQLYVKPEEGKVYYVFNGEVAGDFII